jgi:phosphinothricin acetyltransferase
MIRSARQSDAAALAAIWNHYIRETTVTFLPDEKTEEDLVALIKGTDPMVVWDEGAGVTGFARHFPFRSGRGYLRTVEHTILFAPDAPRNTGAGRALMEALFLDAKGAGKHSMIAGISAENLPAVAFHARLGFTEIARLPQVGYKFGRYLDLVLMQKML